MLESLVPRNGPWSTLSTSTSKWRWVAVVGFLLLVAIHRVPTQPVPETPLPLIAGPSQTFQPQLSRDLDEIHQSGVLRVLLRRGRSGYHLVRGEEKGFEYELVREFAEDLDVRLEVVLPDANRMHHTSLNRGEVDLVAAPLLDTGQLTPGVGYTRPVHSARSVLVTHRDADQLLQLSDLAHTQVAVRRWSSEEKLLSQLRAQGIPVGIVMLSPQLSTDDILEMVADGIYPAAVARDHVAHAAQAVRPELQVAFEVAPERPLRWAVRENSPDLLTAVNRFLHRHRADRGDSRIVRSEFYNVLRQKYFSDTQMIQSREEDPFLLARTGRLSPYDDLFQDVAAKYDVDWRLVASVSFQESRFDPETESWAGAIGLMQVMPRTAGRSATDLMDPAINVEAGVKHLRSLIEAYESLPDEERLVFSLAAYNCGQGHLDDARILTIERGGDPNRWSSVSRNLLLLNQPEYYTKARYGYVRGTETVEYVHRVLRSLEAYRNHLPPPAEPTATALVLTQAEATE